MTRADRRRLLQQLAFSELCHFSWDNFPANTMAYDSDPEPQNLSLLLWVKLCKAATVCQWTAYQCDKTLSLILIWMGEAV